MRDSRRWLRPHTDKQSHTDTEKETDKKHQGGEKQEHKGIRRRAQLDHQRSMSRMADFLLSVGGAMTVTEYWHVDVFRLGLLSNVNFGADWTMYMWVTTTSCFMAKCVKWLPHHGYAVRQKLTNSTSFHHEGLKIALTKFDLDLINSLGGVH